MRTLLLVLLPLAACGGDRYHWDGVPYCQESPVTLQGGRFVEDLAMLTRYRGGGEVAPLAGDTPLRGVASGAPVLVAVVRCQSYDGHTRSLGGDALDPQSLPQVCPGQQTVVEPQWVRPTASSLPDFAGALPFPHVPDSALRCERGSLTRGSGASLSP